jgi:formylglycine-generating enzyme required for sulfatase activity
VELQPDAIIASKLRLLRPLGQGGMGIVWAARHLTLQTDVAVKLIRPERGATDPAVVARFEREARATARIAHPHVVQVMDYGTVDAVPYIVMELLRGFSLAELLERGGRLSFATAKLLVQQVGSALESAHAAGVVHRDIKPHNIFITEGSKDYPLFVKVLDFGVAKMVGDTQVPGASSTLTETGMVIGSPPYMSPEQLEGSKNVDLRSDLWSLGVIVYETLTGTQPFQGSSFVAVGAAVLKGKYRPASELRPDLPPSIDDWFAKALCLDPNGRFQSAPEMVEAFFDQDSPPAEAEAPVSDASAPEPLAAIQAGATASHPPVARRPEDALDMPAPPVTRRRRVVLGAAAAACAVVAGGVGLSASTPTTGLTGAACPDGMVLIEGATVQIGSAAEGETPSDEMPLHSVTLRPYCLDINEVTVEAYAQCNSCDRPAMTVELEGLTPNGRTFWSAFCNRPEAREHPINCVDWDQANAFCAASGKRLPTEAEWEAAARGMDARTYPWGNTPPAGERLNACGSECSRMLTERFEAVGKGPWPRMHGDDDSALSTAPVGHYPAGATPAGVMDLAGNVWEWTDSHYCPYGKDDCGDSRRVLRGSGWDTVESQYVRSAHRRPSAPTARGWSIGFRCARTL